MILPDGVKRTTGGTFDPNEPLTYFLAGQLEDVAGSRQDHILVAVNELRSKKARARLDELLDTRKVFLDSGIFNLAMTHARTHNVSHDDGLSMPPEEIDGFQELWDDYGEIVTRYSDRLWGVVELDQGGVENKPRTRARIEREFGITPVPVYHPLLDGWDYYDTLAKEYDRICFGNIVKAAPPLRKKLAFTAMMRARDYPYLWTHLLGMTPNSSTLAMPFRGSMDSSSWLANVRWMQSWQAFTMFAAQGGYPHEFWYATGDVDSYERTMQVTYNIEHAKELLLRRISEDTHPSLQPSSMEGTQ